MYAGGDDGQVVVVRQFGLCALPMGFWRKRSLTVRIDRIGAVATKAARLTAMPDSTLVMACLAYDRVTKYEAIGQSGMTLGLAAGSIGGLRGGRALQC